MESETYIKAFHNIPIEIDSIVLNSKGLFPFCASRSGNNEISVIVEGGVFVLELSPTPFCDNQSITFWRSWISAPTGKVKIEACKENDVFLWNLKRKEAYEVSLDSTMFSTIEKSNSTTLPSHIIQCEFSPLITNHCYLAILTNYGSLQIYKKDRQTWSSITDVTSLWIGYNKESSSQFKNFNNFKMNMQELKITCFQWHDQPVLTLVTAHKSGTICIWNVEKLKKTLNVNVRHCINSGLKPYSLGLNSIKRSECLMIFIGSLSGLVKSLCVNLKNGTVERELVLWEYEDLIAPTLFKIALFDSYVFAYVVKQNILLSLQISISSENVIEPIKSEWHEFQNVITGLHKSYDGLLLSLESHSVYYLPLGKSSSAKNFQKIDIGVKSKLKTAHSCFGLTLSKNDSIWVIISSSKLNYVSHKGTINLLLYTTETKNFKGLQEKTSCSLVEKISKIYPSVKMTEIFDLIELKKFELLSDAVSFKETYDAENSMTLLQLQILLWDAKLKQYNQSVDLDSAIANLEFLIAVKHAEQFLKKLQKLENPSEMEKKTLNFMLALTAQSKENNDSLNGICAICNEQTTYDNVKKSTCVNGHSFPRCCISFLPCDVVPYATCSNCDSIALINFVSEEFNHCTFCDGLLIMITRIKKGT